MKRSTKIAIAIILIFGVVIGLMSYGKHKFHPFSDTGNQSHYMMSHLSKKLDLDSKQQQKLEAMEEVIKAARLKLRDQTGSIRNEVKSMIAAEPFDRSRMIKIINNKTTAINEIAPDVATATGDFIDSLSANQKAEIMELVARKRYKYGFRHK